MHEKRAKRGTVSQREYHATHETLIYHFNVDIELLAPNSCKKKIDKVPPKYRLVAMVSPSMTISPIRRRRRRRVPRQAETFPETTPPTSLCLIYNWYNATRYTTKPK